MWFYIFKIKSAQFYPCKQCSEEFIKLTNENRFEGKGRTDFAKYMCFLHNKVSERVAKEKSKKY